MADFATPLVAIAGVAASWYCYRWGRAGGHAEGYDAGRTKGLFEGANLPQRTP